MYKGKREIDGKIYVHSVGKYLPLVDAMPAGARWLGCYSGYLCKGEVAIDRRKNGRVLYHVHMVNGSNGKGRYGLHEVYEIETTD